MCVRPKTRMPSRLPGAAGLAKTTAIKELASSAIQGILGTRTTNILLRLLDSGGNGVQNAPIAGSCTTNVGAVFIITQPPLTDANGETTAVVQTVNIAVCPDGDTGSVGSCTFEAAGGTPSVIVDIFPAVLSAIDFSPAGPDCSAP